MSLVKCLCTINALAFFYLSVTRLRSLVHLPNASDYANEYLIKMQSAYNVLKFFQQKATTLPNDPDRSPLKGDGYLRTRGHWNKPEIMENSWQMVMSDINDLHVYSAYLDFRLSSFHPSGQIVIRVLAMARQSKLATLYCYLWNRESSTTLRLPVEAKLIWRPGWDPRPGFYSPFLLSCANSDQLKESYKLVSIESDQRPRAISNALPLKNQHEAGQKSPEGIVVCVKGLDYQVDHSFRLIEWIEANYAMGADKIVIYTYDVHPRMRVVLNYYNTSGGEHFEHVPIDLPGNQPNYAPQRGHFIRRNKQQKRRNELIPYNDCVLRHSSTHLYALLIDIDELVVPYRATNWLEMIHAHLYSLGRSEGSVAALSVHNAFYFVEPEIELAGRTYALQIKRRSQLVSAKGVWSKCFFYIPNVLTVFNHYPIETIRPLTDAVLYLPASVALKNHYRQSCPVELGHLCVDHLAKNVTDYNLARYERTILYKMDKVIEELQLK